MGRYFSVLGCLCASVGLAGCASAEADAIEVCESVVQEAERFPSTMAIISTNIRYESATKDELAGMLLKNPVRPTNFETAVAKVAEAPAINSDSLARYPQGGGFEQASYLRAWMNDVGGAASPGTQSVEIAYDIDNGNGVPERRRGTCKFALSDVEARTPLVPYAEAARLEELRRLAFGSGANISDKGYPCCIPRFAEVSPELSDVAGGIIMMDEIELAVRQAMNARSQAGQ